MAKINKITAKKCWWRREKTYHSLLAGMQTGVVILVTSVENPQKGKINLPYGLLNHSLAHSQTTRHPIPHTLAQVCSQSSYSPKSENGNDLKQPSTKPSSETWMMKIWCIYTVKHCLPVRKMKSWIFKEMSEETQTQKDKHTLPLICGFQLQTLNRN